MQVVVLHNVLVVVNWRLADEGREQIVVALTHCEHGVVILIVVEVVAVGVAVLVVGLGGERRGQLREAAVLPDGLVEACRVAIQVRVEDRIGTRLLLLLRNRRGDQDIDCREGQRCVSKRAHVVFRDHCVNDRHDDDQRLKK